jgi:hypothetical protein
VDNLNPQEIHLRNPKSRPNKPSHLSVRDIQQMLIHNQNPPSIQQVHRTVNDLMREGLLVCTRVKEEPCDRGLPRWVNKYERTDLLEQTRTERIVREIERGIEVHITGTKPNLITDGKPVPFGAGERERLLALAQSIDRLNLIQALMVQMVEPRPD